MKFQLAESKDPQKELKDWFWLKNRPILALKMRHYFTINDRAQGVKNGLLQYICIMNYFEQFEKT